ncbi:MAG: DUF2865 domain-containing protein [Pseudorhodoplanes sp.]
MTKFARTCSFAILACAAVLTAGEAVAQQREQTCRGLEAQLANLDRSAGDPAKAEQIRRLEETVGRQQAELDRFTQQSRQKGCDAPAFFQMFSGAGRSEQCTGLTTQIQQMRGNLARMQADLQRLQGAGANYERDGQRRSVIQSLAQNDCGPQYRAQAAQSRNLFETLFGPGPGAEQSTPNEGTGSGYRTVCVRTCDGYFFPISFSTSQDRFRDDEATCQRMCPASEVQLYSHRNPGEDMRQAVSSNGGKLYTELPTAFKYKTEWSNACVCKQANESWANAVKDDPSMQSAVERQDIVVTEEKAKQLNAPRDAKGRPILPPSQKGAQKGAPASAPAPVAAEPAPPTADQPEGEKKPIRSVGPKFLSQ